MSVLFAGWSDAGNAILCIVCMLGAVILGVYTLAYAAHCLLTVVDQTAAGSEQVVWPDEPVTDWMTRSVYLGFLLAVWVAPAGILSRALGGVWLEDNAGLRLMLLAVPAVWLLFPVGLLSSMSSTSRWIVFRPAMIEKLLRIGPSTAAFYVLTALLAGVTAVPWYFGLFGSAVWLVLLAAPLTAACFLIYARLLGRIGLLVHRLNPPKSDERRRKKKRRRGEPPPATEPEETQAPQEEAEQPPDEEEEIDPRTPPEKRRAYGMSRGAPPPTPKYRPPEDDDYDDLGPRMPQERQVGEGITARLERERRARPKPERSAPTVPLGPPRPLLQGVFGFPWYGPTLGAWLWLTFGLLALGFLCAGVITFYPSGS